MYQYVATPTRHHHNHHRHHHHHIITTTIAIVIIVSLWRRGPWKQFTRHKFVPHAKQQLKESTNTQRKNHRRSERPRVLPVHYTQSSAAERSNGRTIERTRDELSSYWCSHQDLAFFMMHDHPPSATIAITITITITGQTIITLATAGAMTPISGPIFASDSDWSTNQANGSRTRSDRQITQSIFHAMSHFHTSIGTEGRGRRGGRGAGGGQATSMSRTRRRRAQEEGRCTVV